MTKTLAEIYLEQGHLQDAYDIFKILSDKNPSDLELQKKLKDLSEKLNLSPSRGTRVISSAEEKIRILNRWLANIQERRRRG